MQRSWKENPRLRNASFSFSSGVGVAWAAEGAQAKSEQSVFPEFTHGAGYVCLHSEKRLAGGCDSSLASIHAAYTAQRTLQESVATAAANVRGKQKRVVVRNSGPFAARSHGPRHDRPLWAEGTGVQAPALLCDARKLQSTMTGRKVLLVASMAIGHWAASRST